MRRISWLQAERLYGSARPHVRPREGLDEGEAVTGTRVLILGGGGLGTVFAGYLGRAGIDVTLLVKPAQAQAFERSAVRISGLAAFDAPVCVVSDPAKLDDFEYLLVCVKARDTAAALVPLRNLSVACVLSLQNGAGKDETLAHFFGAERVLGAVTLVAGTLERPGEARHTLAAGTQVGELDGRISTRGERLAALLSTAGLPAACVLDIQMRLWYKLAFFLRSAIVGAVTRLDVASDALDPDLCRVAAGVVRDVAAVAAAEGHPLPRAVDGQPPLALPAGPGQSAALLAASEDELAATFAAFGQCARERGLLLYPSLVQDTLAGRPTELEATAGDALARASARGVAVPTLNLCTRLLRGMERVAGGGYPSAGSG
jgi:2-dehydropantoate 2-reductase